jgi:exodeoxyribonuclease VII small subunit
MNQEPSFEESLRRLNEVVSSLENENTALADAMKLYEEGIRLAAECHRQLEVAELKITQLRSTPDGTVTEEELKP